MITKLTIKNFKKLEIVSFELGNPVVLIGPNNSGKTTILQALTLWDIGMRKWSEKNRDKDSPKKSKRPGVAINRKDLLNLPLTNSKMLWFKQHVRELNKSNGKLTTSNVRIEILAEGTYNSQNWKSSLEFDFNNTESIYCRPISSRNKSDGLEIIDEFAYNERIAYLQPMSGLAYEEDKLTPGSIDVRVGMGKTADVLRNIVYQLIYPEKSTNSNESGEDKWNKLKEKIKTKFLIEINKPEFISETGIIEMTYIEDKIKYDLASGGRGFHQTLLLLSYLYTYPGRIILLDEPDAHLELIRQRDIYNLLVEVAKEQNSQLIIASHSEVILQEAGDSGTIVAIFGNETKNLNTPQEISQFRKSLTDIGWDKYYYAKLKGHILYLEGSTDLNMLKEFAKKLEHPLKDIIDSINIHYLSNNIPNDAYKHFFGLKQVIKDLKGIALFDRLDKFEINPQLVVLTWKKREFENYFAFPQIILKHIEHESNNLFNSNNLEIMKNVINDNTIPIVLKNLNDKWWNDNKLSDYLDRIFEDYYLRINQKNFFTKGNYYQLIQFIKPEEIDDEIKEKLDLLFDVLK